MKKTFLLLFATLFIYNCSSSVDVATLSADEFLKYAKSLYDNEDYEEATRNFQAILLQYPASPVNDDAQYYLGMTYFQRHQYILGAYEFSKLIKDIPSSPFVGDAQYMLADSYYELSPAYQLDQAYTKKAIEEFQAFIDFFPKDKRVSEVEKKINELNYKLAEKEFSSARIYEKMGYNNAAIIYYTSVVNTYHDTEFAPKALYRKINLLIDKNRLADAVESMQTYLNRYPDGNDARDVQKLYNEYSKTY